MIRISHREILASIPRGRKGWITPRGEVIPLDDEFDTHATWINRNYDKLKEEIPDLPRPDKTDIPSDKIRKELLKFDWIHVFGLRDMSVQRLDAPRRQRILEAVKNKDVDMNFPIRVYEEDTEKLYTLREENIEREGIKAFEEEFY